MARFGQTRTGRHIKTELLYLEFRNSKLPILIRYLSEPSFTFEKGEGDIRMYTVEAKKGGDEQEADGVMGKRGKRNRRLCGHEMMEGRLKQRNGEAKEEGKVDGVGKGGIIL